MRPLSVQVQVNQENDEEENDDDDNCVLKLPDGTIHTAVQASGDKNVQLSSESQSPSQGRLLPTITEQGVKNTGLSESQVRSFLANITDFIDLLSLGLVLQTVHEAKSAASQLRV